MLYKQSIVEKKKKDSTFSPKYVSWRIKK